MISLIDDAYLVERSNHVLFSGSAAATLTLTGAKPSVAFRVAVTLSTSTGHTDVAGTVTVGSEVITFTAATRKTTTTQLSALPVITTSGLNCTVLVEAIDAAGAPIIAETLTAVHIRMKSRTKSIPAPSGGWESVRQSYAVSWSSDGVEVGDVIRYGSTDYTVSAIEPLRGFASTEIVRKLIF